MRIRGLLILRIRDVQTMEFNILADYRKPSSMVFVTFNSATNRVISFEPCLTFMMASGKAANFSSVRASQNRLRPAGTTNYNTPATTGDSFGTTFLLMTTGRPRLPESKS